MRLMRVDGVFYGLEGLRSDHVPFFLGVLLRWIVYLVSSYCTDDNDGNLFTVSGSEILLSSLNVLVPALFVDLNVYQ